MKNTICICTYNRYEILSTAIKSAVKLLNDNEDYELLIIDNNPDNQYKENYYNQFKKNEKINIIRCKEVGLSHARNMAIEKARGDFITFMDDDALMSPEWAKGFSEIFKIFSKEKIGVIGGPVSPIWPDDGKPDWIPNSMLGFFTILNYGEEVRALNPGEYLCGTNISFDRKAIKSIGGFRTTLGRTGGNLLSNEELELKNRLIEKGFKAFYSPTCLVMHKVHSDRLNHEWLRKRVAWQAVSDLLSENKNIENDYSKQKLKFESVSNFYDALPAIKRGHRSIFENFNNAELVEKQCRMIEFFVYKALSTAESYE